MTGRLAPALMVAALAAGRVAPLSAQNLLTNPDFKTDGTLDAEGSPDEGSAKGVFDAQQPDGIDGEIAQCVPLSFGSTYRFGGKIFIPSGNTATGSALRQRPLPDDSFPDARLLGAAAARTDHPDAAGHCRQCRTDSSTTFNSGAALSGEIWASLAPQSGGRFEANFDDVVVAPGGVACLPDPVTLCLLAGRFMATATFDTGSGNPSQAQAVPIGDSGYFWFWNAANVETFVKMIDGCNLGGHFWFFAAGLTNVHVKIIVTDTQTGAMQVYTNPANTAFQPIQDTAAFPCFIFARSRQR